MTRTISVTPVGDGWTIRSDTFDGDMMFLSGAKAEAAARRLARTLADGGEKVEVRIFLRDGTLGGRLVGNHAPMAAAG